MKMIKAIINEEHLAGVIDALYEHEIYGITVTKVLGLGNLSLKHDKKPDDLKESVKMEIIVSNDHFKQIAIDQIMENAHQLEHGAGKIFVLDVSEVYRIRTGERDESALR